MFGNDYICLLYSMCGQELLTVHTDRAEMYTDYESQTVLQCVHTVYLGEYVHD